MKQAIPLAAAWVCYNLASDIFDDLQDKDDKQRPWNQWKPGRAMQVGVGLIAVAQTCLAQLNPAAQSDILDILGRTMALAALGQNIATRESLDEYFKHTLAKSGLVFAAVAYAGARSQTDEPSLLQAMYDFGLALGMLIQIRDDCRDLLPEQAASDLARATYTLPVLYGLSQQEHRLRPRLVTLLDTANDDHTLEIGRILTDMGALAYSLAVAKVYEQKALSALSVFPVERTVHLITYVSHFLAFQTVAPGH
ncbi:MAG: polyprenyl synthetase family protein [Chloroflexota bacterium]